MSPLKKARIRYRPKIPKLLANIEGLEAKQGYTLPLDKKAEAELIETFSKTHAQPLVSFHSSKEMKHRPLKIGVFFSGGQASGGHNVIAGIYDAIKIFHKESRLFGFLGGPRGLTVDNYKEITQEEIKNYWNQGGFDLIGSGRDKIEKKDQLQAARDVVKRLQLDGLVVIGGDDSNTNAAFLAEYFLSQDAGCRVVGVPKTIDGDLTNEFVQISFGFDTACKTYSEIIGNIARDSLSAGKYTFFIKLMGRSASHIVLECALQTHPNLALIGEEVEKEEKTLSDIVSAIADLICERAEKGKNHGVILIPEGIVEFIPEIRVLISELNQLLSSNDVEKKLSELAADDEKTEFIGQKLSENSQKCFQSLPQMIRAQLIKERDPHGNVQVSKIESDRLLIEMVKSVLKGRRESYKGKFSAQPYFCGYEGRSCYPSNFDANYCYALGQTAALLIDQKKTGYMACLTNLGDPVEEWEPLGIPIAALMHSEMRKGQKKLVVKKTLVDLKGPIFQEFAKLRDKWRLADDYIYPGPIQFFGSEELTDSITFTVKMTKKILA